MKMVTKFEKKYKGCYLCLGCGKKTRETGEGESDCELCRDCYEKAGLENEHNDGHHQDKKIVNCIKCNSN